MRFDDLLRDGKPEAGVLAEALVRPVGVEALEDLLHRIRADAGAVVVDHDLDLVAEAAAIHAHGAVGRRERARIGDQIVDHLAEPGVIAGHDEGIRPAAFEGERDADAVTVLSSLIRSTGIASCRCISASRRLAWAMSEISRSSRFTSCSITASR